MRYLILFFLLFSINAQAEIITVNGQSYACDGEFSEKDFTSEDLTQRVDMNNKIICGSSFSHETPDSIVFPSNLTGAIFIDCNLDDVFMPDGNTVIGGSQRRFMVQNDGMDWLVDENNDPISPLNQEEYDNLGISSAPEDIPSEKLEKNILEETKDYRNELIKQALDEAQAEVQAEVATAIKVFK